MSNPADQVVKELADFMDLDMLIDLRNSINMALKYIIAESHALDLGKDECDKLSLLLMYESKLTEVIEELFKINYSFSDKIFKN